MGRDALDVAGVGLIEATSDETVGELVFDEADALSGDFAGWSPPQPSTVSATMEERTTRQRVLAMPAPQQGQCHYTRAMGDRSLPALHRRIVSCSACPRLVAWRESVARDKVSRYRDHEYWGRPVPGFGDSRARILIVGLAPGAHGANRTGRVFTGDRSGDFLYGAMHRAGLASQSRSEARGDGLTLSDAYVVTPVRCAPPGNAPRPDEIARCAHFLDDEVALLPSVRVMIALGAIAWRAVLDHHVRVGGSVARPRPTFGHGARVRIAPRWLLGSYHVSQQNTQTGKLTPEMFDAVLEEAKRRAIEGAGP
jgi:uracil-DNA glycosylase family 4